MLGVTTKDITDKDSIGYKGSGTKLAAVGALRLGLVVAVASSDAGGAYVLKYEAVPIRVANRNFHQICFRYKSTSSHIKDVVHHSSIVTEAFKDWDQPIGDDDKRIFKVLREFICNARDTRQQYVLDYVEMITAAEEGSTAVYLMRTPEILKIFAYVPRYFKFIAPVSSDKPQVPLYSVSSLGDIYPKSESDKTRLFVQGVLVHCDKSPSQHTLYDYSLLDKTLVSEERIIKSIGTYQHRLAKLFAHLADQTLARHLLENIESGVAKFEEHALAYLPMFQAEAKKAWLAALHELHGEHIAITSGYEQIDADCSQIYGYKVLGKYSTGLKTLYIRLGIINALDIVPNRDSMRFDIVSFESLEPASQQRFMRAFDRLAKHYPERAKLPIVFFYPLDEKMRKIAGFAGIGDNKYKEIWFATLTKTTLVDSEADIYMTLLHEGRHCVTESGDYEREFIDRADQDNQQIAFYPFGQGHKKIQPTFIVPTDSQGEIGPTSSSNQDSDSVDIDMHWDTELDIDSKLPP